eukprot:CAMPEP_0171520794 /NCGR_PEP_ID=MMETSP0959-20130129/6751_1 /TAXON_ID=87120 /ORGANISM="Aurantiochytrium limacinum, Strain ATCCMYA-1381" /LENGTH=465 /DNA_ID=CAMNT_0012060577 /DNA_START=46 /DNA_END=1443 /DNA_ORIENTATION=+
MSLTSLPPYLLRLLIPVLLLVLHASPPVSAVSVSSPDALQAEAMVFFHRHGDRSPYQFMPSDVSNNALWKDGPGMLTTTGMRQLENLGTAFRSRYLLGRPFALLGPSAEYHHAKFTVRSTDFDRTLQSAESFLNGFFPPGSGPAGGLSDSAQPVPMRTMPGELDSVLAGYSGGTCARVRELKKAAMHSKEWFEREKQHEELLEKAAKISGYGKLTLANVSAVSDALLCEKENNMTWLEGFEEEPEMFEELYKLAMTTLRPAFASTPELSRLGGGNMLATVVARFQRAAGVPVTVPERPTPQTPVLQDGAGSSDVRISQFSAHDSTLIALLGALNAFDDDNPPYGSSVVFELLYDPADSTQKYVRVYYNKGCDVDSLFGTPLKVICGDEICTLDEFVKALDPMIPKQYENECHTRDTVAYLRENIYKNSSVTLWTIVLLICMATVFFVCRLRRTRTEPKETYQPVV